MTAVEPRVAPAVPAPRRPAEVTVVVPTFNESGNVAELLRQLESALPADGAYEVLFVDDSTDDTPDIVRALAPHCRMPVSVLHRDEPTGGLGGAVVAGLRASTAAWAVVMDGDLQHPPEIVPRLVEAGRHGRADLVVASRYTAGGSRHGLANAYRQLVSQGSTVVTRAAFPRQLAAVSDPMSGFFAVRRAALRLDELCPQGFKIMLELVVRCRLGRVVEVPFEFRERFAGTSKSSLSEGLRFVRHLAALRMSGSTLSRSVAFGMVGLSGFLPNLGVLWLLTSVLDVHYLLAAVLSTQVAILWNFALLDLLVFTGERRLRLRWRALSFLALNNVDLLARIPLLALLVEQLGWPVVPATAATLVAAFALRFLVTDRLIYLRRRTHPGPAAPVRQPDLAPADLTVEAR